MKPGIEAGSACVVLMDVVVNGTVALGKGERVVVEKVDPNPGRPEYRYVVESKALGKRLQLRDDDLAAVEQRAGSYSPEAEGPGPTSAAPARAGVSAFQRGRSGAGRLHIVVVALLVTAGAALAAFFLLRGGGGDAAVELASKTEALQEIIREAGATSSDLSVEIAQAIREAPTPEEFSPAGKEIADRYIPLFQKYHKDIKAVRADVAALEPDAAGRARREKLLRAADSFGHAMLGYVSSLDQVRRAEIAGATKTFLEVKALIDQGNSYLSGGSGTSAPSE